MSVIIFGVLRLETAPITFPANESAPAAAESDRIDKDKSSTPSKRASAAGAPTDGGFNLSLDNELNFVVEGSHNAFSHMVRERLDHFNRLSRAEKGEQIVDGMFRYGPYAMFVLLPAFAWLQQVSYLGRARSYPGRPRKYVEHLVYAAHIHTFAFLAIAVAIVIPWTWARWLIAAWSTYYVFRAKREIYGGSRVGGVVRTLFVAFCYTVLFFIAMIALIVSAVLVR